MLSADPGPTAMFDSLMTLHVHILASKPQGTLYVGVTNDLVRRAAEHKRYGVTKLVYWEEFGDYDAANARDKNLKPWRRDWIFALLWRKRHKPPESRAMSPQMEAIPAYNRTRDRGSECCDKLKKSMHACQTSTR